MFSDLFILPHMATRHGRHIISVRDTLNGQARVTFRATLDRTMKIIPFVENVTYSTLYSPDFFYKIYLNIQ